MDDYSTQTMKPNVLITPLPFLFRAQIFRDSPAARLVQQAPHELVL